MEFSIKLAKSPYLELLSELKAIEPGKTPGFSALNEALELGKYRALRAKYLELSTEVNATRP